MVLSVLLGMILNFPAHFNELGQRVPYHGPDYDSNYNGIAITNGKQTCARHFTYTISTVYPLFLTQRAVDIYCHACLHIPLT